MTTGPHDPAAAGLDRLRAGHADREQVVEALKTAFVHGRLTKDELDASADLRRAGRAYRRYPRRVCRRRAPRYASPDAGENGA